MKSDSLLPLLPPPPLHDAFIIDALKRCQLSNGTIFSLMWGMGLLNEKLFPPVLVQVVNNILEEESAIEDIIDSEEKKLRRIMFDLDYMIKYEVMVDRLVVLIKKMQQKRVRYGRRPYEK